MNIKNILRHSGKSYTPERETVFLFIKKQHVFSSNDLENHFSGKIGRASIFRTLKLFQELQIIRRVQTAEKGEFYELNDTHHHEHFNCNKCGALISFDSDKICKKIFAEAKKIGFSISEHNLGIFGTCSACN